MSSVGYVWDHGQSMVQLGTLATVSTRNPELRREMLKLVVAHLSNDTSMYVIFRLLSLSALHICAVLQPMGQSRAISEVVCRPLREDREEDGGDANHIQSVLD